jgi:hypothetical protein
MYFISPGDGILVDYPTGEVARQWLDHQYARSQIGSGNWTWVPNSRWVNAFRVGYSHYYDFSQSADGSESPANYSYNGHTYHIYTGVTNPNYFGLPLISIGGGFSFYLGNTFPGQNGPTASTRCPIAPLISTANMRSSSGANFWLFGSPTSGERLPTVCSPSPPFNASLPEI